MTRRPRPALRMAAAVLASAVGSLGVAACGEAPYGASAQGGPSGPVGATVVDPVAAGDGAGLDDGAGVDGAIVDDGAGTAPETPRSRSAANAAPANGGASKGAAASAADEPVDVAVADLASPFTCPPPTLTVLDSASLKAALKAAKPGDVIGLERGSYIGNFVIKKSGTAARPIYLCGPGDAILDARGQNSGYTLHLDGVSNWRIQGFSVRSGQKGIMLDASTSVVLQDLRVSETGHEAVHLRRNSSGNVVQHLVIRKTGLLTPKFGEGIYVGSAQSNWCEMTACKPDRSDRNLVLNNQISLTTAEAVDIKEGTSAGVLSGNTFDGLGMVAAAADSWVDVKGNGWTIVGNKGQTSPKDGFQQHVILGGWGDGNTFSRNVSRLTTAAGAGIMLTKPLKNVVTCDNTAIGGARAMSVPCRP